jgi:hypothetical protein
MQMQNSAPHKSKQDDEFLDTIFSKSKERRNDPNDKSISNDKNSSKGGSNKSTGSKIIVQKINDSAYGSLQSSIHLSSAYLSSHLSFNLSASDSAGNTGRDNEKKVKNSSKLQDINVAPFSLEDDDFLKSGHTLELSDDEDFYISEKELSNKKPVDDNKRSCFRSENILVHNNYMDDQKINIKIDYDESNIHDDEDTMNIQYSNKV